MELSNVVVPLTEGEWASAGRDQCPQAPSRCMGEHTLAILPVPNDFSCRRVDVVLKEVLSRRSRRESRRYNHLAMNPSMEHKGQY